MELNLELPQFLTRRDDGEVVVTGTRIVLDHFVHDSNQGYSAERMAVEFPSVPLAVAHQVIAFYLENKTDHAITRSANGTNAHTSLRSNAARPFFPPRGRYPRADHRTRERASPLVGLSNPHARSRSAVSARSPT